MLWPKSNIITEWDHQLTSEHEVLRGTRSKQTMRHAWHVQNQYASTIYDTMWSLAIQFSSLVSLIDPAISADNWCWMCRIHTSVKNLLMYIVICLVSITFFSDSTLQSLTNSANSMFSSMNNCTMRTIEEEARSAWRCKWIIQKG